jgi:CRP-like cAMP-binding protein
MTTSAWFSRLTAEQQARFSAVATKRKVEGGKVVLRRGAAAAELYVVRSGRLKVTVVGTNGRSKTFEILGPDDLFGEVGMFGGGARTADVTALEPCEFLLLGQAELLRCMREDPTIGLSIMQALAERVMTLSDALEGVSTADGGMRVARSLVRLAERFGVSASRENLRIELRLSQQELADFVGVSRVFVNTKLMGWQRDGVLTQRSGKITVHDLAALRVLAGMLD